MSASSKKKLRKEQEAAQMTEKQLKEQAESKKLKTYSVIFIVIILAVVVAAVAILGVTVVNRLGLVEKSTVAATIDGEELTVVDLNYYFVDAVQAKYNEWYNTYGTSTALYLAAMGLNMSQPLDEQIYNKETGETWADYFIDVAVERAKSDLRLYHMAEEEGFVTPEADLLGMLEDYVEFNALGDLEDFLRSFYCNGATEESFREYAERNAVASAYYNAYANALTYEDADIRAYEADKYAQYSSFTYATYYVAYSDFLEGGTEDEEGKVTYSEEEKDAARAVAKEVAEGLSKTGSLEALNEAISARPENAEKENPEATVYQDTLYDDLDTFAAEWISDESRKENDMECFVASASTYNSDGTAEEIIYGYYVVVFQERNDNLRPLANVRHLLVVPEPDEGATSYTDANKAEAREKAEAILEEWKAGDATEESFIELVKEKSDDAGSAANGGLIEDITPEQGIYVESFTNWAVDEDRFAGDVGIIESEYGYHIMFYAGDDELTYRDYMITFDMRQADVTAWYQEITADIPYVEGNLSRIRTDIIMSTAS